MVAPLKTTFLKLEFSSSNTVLASIIGCMGVWVLAKCISDILTQDKLGFLINFVFFLFILWRGWSVFKDTSARQHEFPLLLLALIWTTWVAHQGSESFHWWLPLVVMTVFIASSQLAFPLALINLTLIWTVLMLLGHAAHTFELISSALMIVASISIHLKSKEVSAQRLDEHIRILRLAQRAARIWCVAMTSNDQINYMDDSLAQELGFHDKSKKLLKSDFIHPGDSLVIERAHLNATSLSVGELDATAACDCRLVRSNGSVLWVRAQFVRSAGTARESIVAFSDIEERLRLEDVIRENQRKLASQSIELTAQFDAAKSALHARQEVERLAQHDLRSPLKSIESAAALLRKGRVLSVAEESLLTSIERTAARALSIVTMSLDLYRMEEGTFQFVPETVDLVVIARSVIGELVNQARTKNVHLEFNAAVTTLSALANHLLTTSVVDNLVRNALEAAPEHSTVTIALYQGSRVGLMVHNEGIVHESIRDEFFEKYATHGKRGGLGLGTYSARLIARAQGGDLTMTTSAARGTLLMLKFNRPKSEAKRVGDARSDPDSFGPSLPGNLVDINLSSVSDSKEIPIELLVVEDDDYNWMLLLSWLPSHVGVRRAINGRAAIEAFAVRRPDVVLMDIEMPIMDGFEALYRIREMQLSAAEAPSIIYASTGYDDIQTMTRIKESGFDGILEKPIQKEKFDKMLEIISSRTLESKDGNELWIEKSFVDAFPTFVESRRALVTDIEQAAMIGDFSAMKRAAHTLAGSPAIHGFHEGLAVLKKSLKSMRKFISQKLKSLRRS
jgi:signal transduction histidine kinase/CheY-like chemotaxis protein